MKKTFFLVLVFYYTTKDCAWDKMMTKMYEILPSKSDYKNLIRDIWSIRYKIEPQQHFF